MAVEIITGKEECKCIGRFARSVNNPRSLPFQAAIRVFGDPRPHCDGALISPNYVLTSAMCLRGLPKGIDLSAFPFTIVLGEYDYNVTGDGEKSFKIESRLQGSNIFALLKLAKPAKISQNIKNVCLPTLVATKVCVFGV